MFAPQKVPPLKIFDHVIACDLWFVLPPPIKNPGYACGYNGYLPSITVTSNQNWGDMTKRAGELVKAILAR